MIYKNIFFDDKVFQDFVNFRMGYFGFFCDGIIG